MVKRKIIKIGFASNAPLSVADKIVVGQRIYFKGRMNLRGN